MAQEDILIRIRAIDEATNTIKRVSGSLKQLSAPIQQMTGNMKNVQKTIIKTYKPAVAGFQSMEEATSAAGISMNLFNKFANKNFLEIQKGGVVMDKLTGETMSYGKAAKDAAVKSRRFKFEWLSIMFAGMALDRAFGGLIKSQLELFGITDLMSDAWMIVLLPVMELITPLIYSLIEAFMELPEGTKLAIGGFILFAAGIGKIMLILGQLSLAVMGLKILFSGWGGIIFLLVGGALAAFIASLFKSGEASGKLQEKLSALGISEEVFSNLSEKVISFWRTIKEKLPSLDEFIDFGRKLLTAIVTGIHENIDKIVGALEKIFDTMSNWIDENFEKFVEIGARIAWAIIKGIATGLFRFGVSIGEAGIAGTIGDIKRTMPRRPPTPLETVAPMMAGGGGRAGGGGTQTITVTPTYNISSPDPSFVERIIKAREITLIEEIKRRVGL